MMRTRSRRGCGSGSTLRGVVRSRSRRAPPRRRRASSDRWTPSSIGVASSPRSVAAGRASRLSRRTRIVRARRAGVAAEQRYTVRRARGSVPADLLAVDAVLARDDTRILQSGVRTSVGSVTRDGTQLVLKRFHEHTLARVLETLALGSGAARAWRGAARLGDAGFDAPEIVAVLERRRLGVP